LGRCEDNLRSQGRHLETVLNAGASDDELSQAESALGFALPTTLRAFLSDFNGLSLIARGEDDDALSVPDTRQMVEWSNRLYGILCDKYNDRAISVKPPFYLSCGVNTDGQIVLKMGAKSEAAPEPAAFA